MEINTQQQVMSDQSPSSCDEHVEAESGRSTYLPIQLFDFDCCYALAMQASIVARRCVIVSRFVDVTVA